MLLRGQAVDGDAVSWLRPRDIPSIGYIYIYMYIFFER